jgi:hypothetical protein
MTASGHSRASGNPGAVHAIANRSNRDTLKCLATQSLQRELFRRRITVLLTAHPAVVPLGRFVQLEVAVRGKGLAALAQRLHFLRRHRLEAAYDPQVLAQYVQRIHAADGGRDRQAHGVPQRFLCTHDAVEDRLAIAGTITPPALRGAISAWLSSQPTCRRSTCPIRASIPTSAVTAAGVLPARGGRAPRQPCRAGPAAPWPGRISTPVGDEPGPFIGMNDGFPVPSQCILRR